MRTMLMEGWDAESLLKGLAAIAVVGTIAFGLAFAALRGRVTRS